MVGKAAMIAVLLAPIASIDRHDDHRTDTDPVRWFNSLLLCPALRDECGFEACALPADGRKRRPRKCAGATTPGRSSDVRQSNRGRSPSPTRAALARARAQALVGEGRDGGSRRPCEFRVSLLAI